MPYRAKFFQALSGSSGSVTLSYELTTFTSSGTWTKPANCVGVEVFTFGAAGGGGSGSRRASGVIARGGSGGATGLCNAVFFAASAVGSTVTVTVGAGGSGGEGVKVDNTDGNLGGQGGTTSFGALMSILGGNGGGATSAGGAYYYSSGVTPAYYPVTQGGASGRLSSTTGGAGNTLNQQDTFTQNFPNSPAGGGINTSDTTSAGGIGSQFLDASNNFVAAAVAGAANGGNGNAGTDNTAKLFGGGPIMLATGLVGTTFAGNSGSGGGSSKTSVGGDGGASGRGAGGAGGGATRNGFNSGAGGAGGNGFVKVLAIIAS